MRRETRSARVDWREQLASIGFEFHTPDGQAYWDETACYAFTAAEIDGLENATNELESLCLQAVDHIVQNRLFRRMQIPEIAESLIVESWQRGDKNLYGRFDLAYDGHNPPKMLEYNADTPTALFEAAVVQWHWLESVMPQKDQFNSLHEQLIEAWRGMDISSPVHFACITESQEDLGTTMYLQDTASQAGHICSLIAMKDIGSDGQRFFDLHDQPIDTLFKLYPWEWMLEEEFAPILRPSGLRVIEPAWKMLLSNKALLPLLWEMFEGHPNLLRASFNENDFTGRYAKKPIFGREGSNITLRSDTLNLSTSGDYGSGGYVYQELVDLPDFDGNYPIIGSWVIASQSAGIGIREDKSPITSNMARFIPHYFE